MNLHKPVFSIGALAKASDVTAPAIRFYEEIGLLPKARRSAAGQRYYENSDLSRLAFIKQCRDFGFGIEQVRVLLDLSISSERDCTETRDIAQAHLDEVRTKLEELRIWKSVLLISCSAVTTPAPAGLEQDASF
ncbi:MerR family transcriptional regulator [Rhizobium jaguaris]|uniref:MerR family transcriptional regulator n=1 Tax=Rhizobium jaguaris TaxID=1312183 RepID=UPI0039BF4F84